MPRPVVPADAQPCLWMSAGLLTYRLCDRDFDCDRCPLDAALRGDSLGSPRREALLAPRRDARVFPEDRVYTTGHSWIQVLQGTDARTVRFGLDAFAAAIIGRCSEVRCQAAQSELARGGAVCQIDLGLGILSLGVPLGGTIERANNRLQDYPEQVVTAPYGDGWIAELTATNVAELNGLLTAARARERARLDLQRFRRRVAMQLLAGASGVGPSLADGGEWVADLREMLGGPTYMDLLRELIH